MLENSLTWNWYYKILSSLETGVDVVNVSPTSKEPWIF